jgi:hypothetical protein
MKIDRTNYEEWLQDWFDGNLTRSEAEEVRMFLELNPDIKSEFESISSIKLTPEELTPFKQNKLIRELKDIPDSQFELLCAAYMEDDLNDEQKAEINELIDSDSQKLKVFKAISAMKLKTPQCSFAGKNMLFKKEPAGKIYRFIFTAMSAAAIIAFLLLTGVLSHQEPLQNKLVARQSTFTDSSLNEPVQTRSVSEEIQLPRKAATLKEVKSESQENYDTFSNLNVIAEREPAMVARAEVYPIKSLADEMRSDLMDPVKKNIREIENFDYRSNTGKFISRIFRKEIMKEETPSESPLKAYEVAEAGIRGMNRLLGWNMAISRNNDENGEIKSVYFNSRVISFRTPVKKNENGE